MAAYPLRPSEWIEQPHILPDQSDFFTSENDLDSKTAWKNFGFLNLPQAYDRFCENPHYYQEDFMFMGGKAFAFYYPVIERYLFECSPTDEDDCEAWIIAQGIRIQLKSLTAETVKPLRDRLLSLAEHVLSKLDQLTVTERANVHDAWVELKSALKSP